MARPLPLALYALAAGRGARGAPDLPPAPGGSPCVWLHAARPGRPVQVLVALAYRLLLRAPGLAVVLSHAGGPPPPTPAPAACLVHPLAADTAAAAAAALARWVPGAIVLGGEPLAPALIDAAAGAGVPVMLVEAGAPTLVAHAPAIPGLQRAVLRGLERILVPDREAETLFWRAGAPSGRLEVAGSMGVLAPALPHNAAERAALAQQLGARPVWLAVDVPEGEEAAVLAAQHAAHRLAHRLLLILVPSNPARGAAILEAAAALGLRGGQRSADAEPGEDDQIYVADTEGELGLWYRLAPVSFMGGTLEEGTGRDPLEAAALGSAILHGPRTAPHEDSYSRLAARRASQRVTGAGALAEAVIGLLNPERAARMARGGWEVATEGGEVTDSVAGAVLALLDRARR